MPQGTRKKDSGKRRKVYGYPVADAKSLGLVEWFRDNKHVAGMAWGGGLNGTTPSEERVVVANPFHEAMGDPRKRKALYILEASRHVMDENGFKSKFKITPDIETWRRKKFNKQSPYRSDDRAFRETVLSRVIVGDDAPVNPEIQAEAEKVKAMMQTKSAKAESFLENVYARGRKR